MDITGLSLVTTVVTHLGLGVGDVVRVVHCTDDMAWCGDEFGWIPRSHIYPMHVPVVMRNSPMESFLTKTSQLSPDEGWAPYLRASGVRSVFKSPRSWQFSANGWGEKAGKTGGLHMRVNPDGSRRCQLSVEHGICGDSLIDTIKGSKAGILMYLPNMNPETNSLAGHNVSHETALTLSFSALLLAYIETVSIVRKEVYRTPHHPRGGQVYANIEWDFTHLPFHKPWMVFAHPKSNAREVRIDSFAVERAAVWLRAERVAVPDAWKDPVPRALAKGTRVSLRLHEPGVHNWVGAVVTDEEGPTFDVPVPPHTLCRTDDAMFFV